LPPELPPNAEIVNTTANNFLPKIARQIAGTEYADFEEIEKDIQTSVDAVNAATPQMDKAINDLSGMC